MIFGKKKKVLRAVFNNEPGMRYTPRHYGESGGYGWKVWDNKEMRWVEDRELKSIDPTERMSAA